MSAALLTLPVTAAVLFSAAPVPSREVDNVAAFGRLYGVVRFFYPSDAAAELDWNRFAADGVKQVREARSTAELATTLERLVAPLGPGIEVKTTLPPPAASGASGQPLVAWRYLRPVFKKSVGSMLDGPLMRGETVAWALALGTGAWALECVAFYVVLTGFGVEGGAPLMGQAALIYPLATLLGMFRLAKWLTEHGH